VRLRQARLLEAVARLGQALAERAPVVILLDDVQWADADTRHVLTYSIRRWRQAGTPVLVVLAVRSEETGTRPGLARWLTGLEREAPVLRLPLGPLAAEDVRRWVGALTGDRQPNPAGGPVAAFGRWLMDRTGGQPSLVVRVLRTLLDEGVVGLRPALGEGWVLDIDRACDDEGSRQRLEEVLGRGLRASVRDLLRRLDATASALLTAAVTLDERFSADTVLAVARVDELAGLHALEQLVRAQVLRESGDGRYAFSHRPLRAALEAEIGEPRRRLYRLRALELTQRPGDAVGRLLSGV
jgi:predicted ATPase